MHGWFFVVVFVASASACCYTLSVNPRGVTIPVYTWYLDILSQNTVSPTACVGTLQAVDALSARVGQCDLLGVWYRPMDVKDVAWQHANLTQAQRVLFTQPCVGFGPYKVGDDASSLLLHRLSDAWIKLALHCTDSVHESCVRFGLRLRDSSESRLVADEERDPDTAHCLRTPSPTPSHTATPPPTATNTPTPSETPMPVYGAVYRAELTFETGIFMAMQFGLNYAELSSSDGERGAHFCSVPVLDAGRTQLLETLHADDESLRIGARSHALAQWLADQERERSKIQVTVVWQTGGWCRVTIDSDNNVDLVGCRIFVGDQVHETVSFSSVMALDARAVPVCGVVVTISSPSASTAPLECRPDRQQTRFDPDRALVVMRSETRYAEAALGEVLCSDKRWHTYIVSVSDVVVFTPPMEMIACQVEDELVRRKATCGNDLLLELNGDSCETIRATMAVDQCAAAMGQALLLTE